MSKTRSRLTALDKASILIFFKRGRVTSHLRFLIKMLQDDIEIASHAVIPDDDGPKLIGNYLYLFPNEYPHQISQFKNLKEVAYVVRHVRGLVRWLSAGLFVKGDPQFGDAYLMTRFELFRLLLKRIRPVLRLTAKHMALLREDNSEVQNALRIDPKNYINAQTVISWPPPHPLQLIPDFSSKSAIRFAKENSLLTSTGLLEELITWNSYYFTRLIHEFQLLDKVLPYLTIISPSLLSELAELTAIRVNRTRERILSFDQHEKMMDSNQPVENLKNAEIWHQRFIIADSQLQIVDCTTDPTLDFVAGQWQFIFPSARSKDQCLIKSPTKNYVDLEDGIFLAGRVDENWYHFLLDTLPRLLFLENAPNDVPFLVRDNLPKAAKHLIARLSSRAVIEMKGDLTYRVKRLYFLPARSTVFDSKPIDGLPAIQYSPRTIARLRSLIWDIYDEPKPEDQPIGQIAILRNSTYRNVTNIQKVREVSAAAGFKVFEPSEAFYRDQIHIFANASKVLAPGGAVLANMIFMQPLATVIALRSWRTSKLPLWRELALACNLDYLEVVGTPTYFGTRKMQRQHSDYSISPRKLLRKLS